METIEIPVLPHNGVPRSAFFRAVPRLSTWHRPYAVVLLILDWLATVAGQLHGDLALRPGRRPASPTRAASSTLVAYVFLPLGWVIILWGHGAYDRRYLGVGADEFKRVFRAAISATATVSFIAFATKIDLSRLSVGTALLGAPRLHHGRSLAGPPGARADPRAAAGPCTACCWSGRSPRRWTSTRPSSGCRAPGLVPVGIHLTESYAQGRGTDSPVPVYAGRDIMALVRDLERRHDRGLWIGRRRSPASCAGWPGRSRAPASTWWSLRS